MPEQTDNLSNKPSASLRIHDRLESLPANLAPVFSAIRRCLSWQVGWKVFSLLFFNLFLAILFEVVDHDHCYNKDRM